ncbi:hypothetical protein [Polaribacter sp. Asnod6-C07]|uniref:hypothetical protein n=1 Tax=Polaribacter sp. Asnod6-C07 TaxID=3160582 RepID=UPI0038651C46
MKRIQLNIKDEAYAKFLLLLSKFNKDEIKIIEQIEHTPLSTEYIIDNKKTAMVSETITEKLSYPNNASEETQDWWTELSKEEKEDIKIGIDQANKGNLIENDKVMNRFKKWH